MSSVLPKNMFRLINILILVTGIHAVCKRQKTISSGVLSGEYYLKEENSKYCGDGCLYSRQDDPLSHHNQPFGYCMEFTDDCSCTGHCGPLPGLNDGKFTKCKDANGVLVNISPLTEPEEIKYPEGTRCTLDCSREQSQTRTLLIGPALNSRY
ncbi:uncharacterized protein LOC111712607 [Eurytemora carolleeae]|uniref:uncharacterized protein LOC111712607 n=1 Tax=Eurytemora carolleeae TaxID=1294199 RepID=UPI000C788551|nr:uncharacterized protein LOC111712607 [Eurytemora carolleeae]|eukprot:XP_023343030.1 uncharacterized protein LOC111712607 [Eurytemora affinis]